MDDPWAELHVLPTAPAEVVEAAYRALVKLTHPDAGGATAQMARINHAHDLIRSGVRPSRQTPPSEPPAAHVEMPWGKHQGRPLRSVPSDYLSWLLQNASHMDVGLRDDIARVLQWRRAA